jgi:hypothetical protein
MQISTTKYQSRVLMDWLAMREGGVARAGVLDPAIKNILPENGATNNLTADQLAKLLGATVATAAGTAVTPETALRNTVVYGCVSLISGAISTLPLPVYERTSEDSRRRVQHDYWWMLNEQANDRMHDGRRNGVPDRRAALLRRRLRAAPAAEPYTNR